MEEALIQGEIDELTNKQNHNENNDDEDEDLKEFKRIENEIKISELNKSLEAIRNEIKKSKKTDTSSNANAPLAQTECLTDEQSNSGTIGSSNQLFKRRINERRPLTLYLPISDDQLDLVHHITTLGHDIASNHDVTITTFTCSGFLFKLCSNSSISKWRKRYFNFDRQNQIFVYHRNKKYYRKGKISGGVHFDEIHNVYVDHNRINENHRKRNVFIVATTSRQFILSTFSPETMRIWIDVVFTGAQAYQQF